MYGYCMLLSSQCCDGRASRAHLSAVQTAPAVIQVPLPKNQDRHNLASDTRTLQLLSPPFAGGISRSREDLAVDSFGSWGDRLLLDLLGIQECMWEAHNSLSCKIV